MDPPHTPAALETLRTARALLENPGLAARMTNLIGSPIEKGLDMLPSGWNKRVGAITKAALVKAADVAISTLGDQPSRDSSNRWHKLSVATTGGVGGFFGLAGLAVELPISTTIMMRSIADIARSEGESPNRPDTRLGCIEVFALGGKNPSDDGTESGYYLMRAALAQAVGQATEYVAGSAAGMAAPPALMRLISVVSQRFGIQVTEKAAAQAMPAIGAAGGALINTLFIDHFQDMARGHFIVRRLERSYGKAAVKQAYDALEG
ncbi:MAG: EcsC family protein [Alcaligenaceae bacterium]|nr:EcsC family protein [Alcaligenaceae bacterium]